MELWKVGECILRPQSTSTLPFLRPSLQQSRRFTPVRLSPSVRSLRRTQPPYRSLTTSSQCHAEDTPSAPIPPSRHQATERPSTPNPSSTITDSEKLSSLLDDVLKPPSRAAPTKSASPRSSASISETSAGILSSHLADVYRSEASLRASRQGQIFSAMNMPSSVAQQPGQTAGNKLQIPIKPRAKRTIKSRPSVGRTIQVGSAGLGVALQQLAREVRVNNVIGDLRRDKYYERRGIKRKRLKSERWRKRFKEMFRSTLYTVSHMRKQGW